MIGTNIRNNNLYIFLEDDDVLYLGDTNLHGLLITNDKNIVHTLADTGSIDLIVNNSLCNRKLNDINISDKTELTKSNWLVMSINENVYQRIRETATYNSNSNLKNVTIIDSSKDMTSYETNIYEELKTHRSSIIKN